jgi:DNA-binding NarL/FixJ family response regulator
MAELTKGLQVYVVEDSPIILQLLTSTIVAAGADLIGHSGTAQRAINEISVLQPDLILVDIGLDFGSGFDVLRVLQDRGISGSAKKVVLTNHANAEYRALCLRLGADHFFDKASDTWQVLALISAMADSHGGPARAGRH